MFATAAIRGLIVAGVLTGTPAATPETPLAAGRRQLLIIPQNDPRQTAMSGPSSSVSANGRFVALSSFAPLAAADEDAMADIYVLDRETGAVTLESSTADGRTIDGDNSRPRLNADGRYVVFETAVPASPGHDPILDVIVRDRSADRSVRVCQRSGTEADGWCGTPAVSEDGQTVAFASTATNLVPDRDENGHGTDIYLLRVATRAVSRISLDSRQRQRPGGGSFAPAISPDGRYIVFASTADLDGPPRRPEDSGAPPRVSDVYLRDIELNVTRRISIGSGGQIADGSSRDAVVSRGGTVVAFASDATNLVAGDRNRSSDVFLFETATGSTRLLTRSPSGGSANGGSRGPGISADGRFVVFQSDASDLVCVRRCDPAREDVNLLPDVFLFDTTTGQVTWISIDAGAGWIEESASPALDSTGSIVSFVSRHPIDGQDTDHDFDLFVCVVNETR